MFLLLDLLESFQIKNKAGFSSREANESGLQQVQTRGSSSVIAPVPSEIVTQ